MFRVVLVAVLLGALTSSAPAAPPSKQVVKGHIKDVWGTYGTLTLILGESKQAKEKTLPIQGARIVGLAGAEWKIDDLREGDPVEVEITADGKLVQEIRVLPGGKPR